MHLTLKDKARFWSKVKKGRGCWIWKGKPDAKGYGRFGLKRKNKTAQRVSYFINVGPVPRKLLVRHTCDNRICVNPKHLRLGDDFDNALDKMIRQRHHRQKIFNCPNGHPYDFVDSNGNRACRRCANARALKCYYNKRKNNVKAKTC